MLKDGTHHSHYLGGYKKKYDEDVGIKRVVTWEAVPANERQERLCPFHGKAGSPDPARWVGKGSQGAGNVLASVIKSAEMQEYPLFHDRNEPCRPCLDPPAACLWLSRPF
jgi:hypothetical protein